jgi:hypothetical protein
MGFLAPVGKALSMVPWGKIFGNKNVQQGLTGVGSTILGSKLSGGSGGVSNPKALLEQQTGTIKEGRDIASSLRQPASNFLDMASRSYSPVANYWAPLLSGNRTSTMQSLSPEIQQINSGYDAAGRSAELAPRGGGRSAFFSDLPYQRNRDITNLMLQSRPMAARGLLETGRAAGGEANNLYSTLLSALHGSTVGTSSLLDYDLKSRSDQYGRGKELGKSIFDILSKIKFGKGKSTSTSDDI